MCETERNGNKKKEDSNGITKVMVGIIYVRLNGREILRLFVSKLMRVVFFIFGYSGGRKVKYRVLYVCLPMIELLLIVSMLLNTVLFVLILRNN